MLSKENITQNSIRVVVTAILALGIILNLFTPTQNVFADSDAVSLQEGNDFATQVLGDPWDMNEFSDIGTYLNNSNQAQFLTNVSVANSLFSATSVSNDPQFTLLFPDYLGAMAIGKVGANYPIDSSKYQCLYLAMDVESMKPDYFEVYWFADHYMNGGSWGTTNALVTKDYGWNLYSINLATSPTFVGNTRWSENSLWQGLRIDPSVKSSSFSMDWARLTDCQPVDFHVSGLPTNTSLTLYIVKDGREIRASNAVQTSTGTYTFDLQGVEAGSYGYLVRNSSNNVVASGSVNINQAPIANFVNPSGWTGQDYSETLSVPWDMETSDSVNSIYCSENNFSDGLLNIATASKESLPSNCVSGGYADPKIFLKSLNQINSAQYRYLNFKMNADGPWEDVPNGMIVRFIWIINGTRSGTQCSLVSDDIPFTVGTNTYSIDLFDPNNGKVVERSGYCPSTVTSWLNSGNVISFRFDPNENQLGRVLNQQIDWIRLTKQASVQIGNHYQVKMNLNKPVDNIQSWNFYYTTDPSNPRQHTASVSMSGTEEPSEPLPGMHYTSFLPMLVSPGGFTYQDNVGDVSFSWNTTGVTPGEYYLCTEMNDGLNNNVYCTDVSVILYNISQ